MSLSVFDLQSYLYTLYAAPTLITAAALLIVGFSTLYRERGSRVSLSFLGLSLAASWWLFSFSMMYSAATESVAVWWTKIAYLSIPLIAPSAYHFTVTVLRIQERRKWVTRLIWSLGLLFAALAIGSDELIAGVYKFWWGYYTRYDWLSVPFLAFFITVLIASLAEYWLEYRKTEPGIHRLRIRSLMIALGIAYLGAYDFIAAYGLPLYPIGYIAVFVFLLLIARAIGRYRLVDLTPSFAADQIVATMADPLIVCDSEGKIRVANQAICAVFGYAEQELLGQPIAVLCNPSPGSVQHLRERLRQPIVRDEEMELWNREGKPISVSVSISHLWAKDGSSLGTVVIARDIRERKEGEAALRASEERLRTVVSKAPVILFALDRNGVFTLAEGQFMKPFGIEASQLVGRSISDILPETSRRPGNFERALMGGHAATTIELGGFTYDARYSPLRDESGEVVGLIGVGTEITERKQAEEALRESEERYALAARGANDGLWDWNLTEQTIYFSPRWKAMLGFEDGEIGSDPNEWFDRIHPEDGERVQQEIWSHLAGRTAHLESEHRVSHSDGSYRWVLCRGLAVRDADGLAYRAAGSLTDITQRKITEEQLLHDAFHDTLTGLPNRALLIDRLKQVIARSQSVPDSTYAVLFLDFDHFKVVNDSLGHMVGDQLLAAIARRLEANQRPYDTVARLGGDEFVILLDHLQEATDATQIAERIQREMSAPFILGAHEVFTSVSIGIVAGTARYEQPEDVLRDADIALHRVKTVGRGRYQLFDMEMHARAVERMQMETDLRRVVERGELRLHYQPIVALDDGHITGFEALVRWQHPVHGLVPPATFIPIAEETGLIIPIGAWVLREACRQLREWQQQFPASLPLTVSVNLSGKQLAQADLVEQIRMALAESGLDGRSLKLEVTESVFIENADSASRVLQQLQALGVEIYLDDFGTGYSSLSYLHNFPVNVLKIDRSFITRMGMNGNHSELIETIIALAEKLHIRVVAEGVEHEEQRNLLRALACEYAQGYYFSPPVLPEAAEVLLAPMEIAA